MIKSNIMKFIVGLAIYGMPFVVNAELVNINNASAAALSHYLTGIGTKKAESIVSYREINGDFKVISDITNVKGIGEKLLEKNIEDMSLTEGVVKLVKVKSEDKVVVIEAKKTALPKKKLQASKKVASNDVMQLKLESIKKKKVGLKKADKKQAEEKMSSDSVK